jgi:serine/threonine-protein kinase
VALTIASSVAAALHHAHQLGIVHRDVSPSNVFISQRGDVKLGDFGIARATEKQRQSKTQAGTLKGKYGYMAPEQVVGGDIDGRADLFAVGIVLSEMLMGRRLFTAPNDLDVLLMVRDARLDRLNRYGGDIPPALRKILDRVLARDPETRYATAGTLRDVLHEFLFESRQRVTAADLGQFLDSLSDRSQAARASESEDSGLILVGEDTRARQQEAERNRKALQEASKQPAMVQRALEIEESGPFIEEASAPKVTIEAAGRTPVEDAESPDLKGDFADVSPVRLLARLAADRETGQLVVERGPVTKEIFLVDGAPEFVSSNVPAERFGEYLVARGVISAGELSMALAILPRFQGKLGDTLVGLSLLRPLEVFRHLTRQVRDKIIDVFAWQSGHYRYYRGRMNNRESFPLGLDAFEILGAGVAGLPLEPVRLRMDKLGSKRARRVERQRPTPEHFRVGAGPRELWQRLDGKRTVGEWMRRYEQPEQLLTLCRTLFLLIESDLAALD